MTRVYKSLPVSIEEEKSIISVYYKPYIRYDFSAGQALSKFLLELKNGRIVGRKCNKCGRILVPPRLYCEQCFRFTDEWVYVRDEGIVTTAVVSYITQDAKRVEKPEIIGVIELIDAPGQGIFHRINVDPKEVIDRTIFGKRVKAVWKRKEERVGDINDILYFEPVK